MRSTIVGSVIADILAWKWKIGEVGCCGGVDVDVDVDVDVEG